MMPPAHTQSYDPSGSTAAPTEHGHDESSTWKNIEEEDDNMLVKLERPRLRKEFETYLQDHTTEIQDIVSYHLSLKQHQHCMVAERSSWMHGDFNACIPISVTNWRTQRLLLRCPFPHMLSGSQFTNNADEKVRCEAASFAWISQNCAEVPVPRLWGFGLPGGLCFTPTSQLPWYMQILVRLKDCWAWLRRRPRCAPFVPRQRPFEFKSGYLLVDFIEEEQGTMLSDCWPPKSVEQKQNFYRSLAKVMLDLASRPQEKIGSLTIRNSGEMSLSNRPLTLRLPLLETEGIPTNIPRDRCYSTVDSYAYDLLNCLDSKLIHQPNAAHKKYESEGQMAVLSMLRASSPHFMQDQYRHGPFIYSFTDLNQSNIFVDRQYNISSIVDIEWCCFLPIEAQHPPFWLSGHPVDDLREGEQDYINMCKEFLDIFEKQDNQCSSLGPGFCTKVMRDALEKNSHWFWACLREPRAANDLFLDHLQPCFAPEHSEQTAAIQFQQVVAPYWCRNSTEFIQQKVDEHDAYVIQLRSKYRARYP